MLAAWRTASTDVSLIRATSATLQCRRVGDREPIGHPGEIVDDTVRDLTLARREAFRLHDERLVPLSDAALASAQASYQAGNTDLTTVLEAARAVRLHHQDHVRFLVDYARRLSDLEEAVGAPPEGPEPDRDDEKGGAR